MKILVATVGTRGDVQPYVALGRALKASGNEVAICTCAHYEPFVRENGLDYAFVNNDFIDFMHTPEGRIILGNAGNLWKTIKTVVPLISKLGDLQERQMQDVWSACQAAAPDLILYHMKAVGAPDFAEKLGVPCMMAFWLPMFVPTRSFPAMGFPDLPLGTEYRKMTYRFIRMATAMAGKRIQKWRTQNGLSPRSPGLRMKLPGGRPIPVLHGFSRHIIPRPDDWEDTAAVTGYWFLDQAKGWEPPEDLTAFLEDGDPPVYFGFGSIFGLNPEKATRIILEAVRQTGVRAILARGWGGIEPSGVQPPESVKFIDAVPHDWLFPKVSAVVHHGGCGTTAAGLLAGKPAIICPFFGDQPFWGRHMARLGAAPLPIPHGKLTVTRLARAMDTVIHDKTMRRKAAFLGDLIREENGTANAASFIMEWMGKQ